MYLCPSRRLDEKNSARVEDLTTREAFINGPDWAANSHASGANFQV